MIISGNIKDFQNEPLAGANVFPIVNGKSIGVGVITDFDGNFNLEANEIQPDTEIKITYLGFKPQIKLARELNDLNIVMEESVEQLDEVLIVAKKKPQEPKNKISDKSLILIGSAIVALLAGLVVYDRYK